MIDTLTASDMVLDYFSRKQNRSKDCYPFDCLDVIPKPTHGKKWLIKGIIARGETSAWIAPPGGMKSALMAQLAFAVANFKDWNGLKHKTHAAVVYFALERADLVRRRLWAHSDKDRRSPDDDWHEIVIVPSMVDLTTPDGVRKVIATLDAASEEIGPIGLIIFDTFAKLVAAGGGDEDKAKDQGKVFANIQRVKDHFRGFPHVAIVGHTGKDESRGARGSNAFLGDADVMVTISGDEIKTATVTKANDAPEGPLFSFKSETYSFGTDEDGDPITVNIVSGEEVSRQVVAKPTNRRLSPRQQLALEALTEATLLAGTLPAPSYGLPAGIKVVAIDRWKDELYSRAVLNVDDANPRAEFKRIQEGLAARSRIGRKDGFVWRAA